MNSNLEEIKQKVKNAINQLRKNDAYLLENDSSEESISSTLHCYLKKQFDNFDVDCEYNRRQNGNSKLLNVSRDTNNDESHVIPDIIIHSRNSSDSNFLIIEVKKSNNSNEEIFYDEEKLKEFTSTNIKNNPSTYFGYSYGLAIIFKSERESRLDDPIFKWFINGKMVEVENQ
ncbi:hypothetical protein [Methanobacterium alcaliphilum]|uniref:hypothetical protein n=1 Tax=Methanobacterium alcaliphilum TaxID=392018 RepID=UPI00200A1871|nr:hypothetical protein [Methanobacterium alcaliphilum]MCK9150497.1 hypothetical protein [Methanobacterium alcaliphilum]